MRRWIGCVIAGCVIPAMARAEHHHVAMPATTDDSTFHAGMSLLAARFQTMDYAGDYEGVMPEGSWTMGRYAAGASLPLYRILENGNKQYGLGDLVVHGQVGLFASESVHAGLALAVSAPTGNHVIGLGMGHTMAMPAAWVAYQHDRVLLGASFGYSRALDADGSHHDHGPWPLVEPMNPSELTWSASGEVVMGAGVRGGARMTGGIPVGAMVGHERVIGALRAAWTTGPVDTGVELQAGLVGDPFELRGVLQTSMSF